MYSMRGYRACRQVKVSQILHRHEKTSNEMNIIIRFFSGKRKYPPVMDLGDGFYNKLLDPDNVKSRRLGNTQNYPSKQESFMKMLPKMQNADEFQFSIYWDGVYGKLPRLPVDPALLTQQFVDSADPDCVAWLMGRAGSKQTYHDNISDFDNWKLLPRMMTGVKSVDPSIDFKLGDHIFRWETPFAVAPVGVQGRVTKAGDLVTAAGAAAVGVPFIVSAVSSVPLEEIVGVIKATNPNAPAPWFQLYNSTVPEISLSMMRRAKESGYGAIVVTLDTSKYGYRSEELDAAYFPQADTRLMWSQMTWDPVFNQILKDKFNCVAHESFGENGKYKVDRFKSHLASLSFVGCGLGDTWFEKSTVDGVELMSKFGVKPIERSSVRTNDNLSWLINVVKNELKLPLIMKGIMHPEDAIIARNAGVDAIIVSNHGGRQVDGCLSTIEALPNIVEELERTSSGKSIPVFLDSGVRYGQHVVKALALGATGVMVGRMPVIGACLGGEEGVQHVLLSLLADTQCTMVNCGYGSTAAVKAMKLTRLNRSSR